MRKAEAAPVSRERLKNIRGYIAARVPLTIRENKISVDEKEVESLLPEAVEANPSFKDSVYNTFRWIWGGEERGQITPQQRSELKNKLMVDFNRAAGDLPFPAAELDNTPASPKRHIIMADPLEVTYEESEDEKWAEDQKMQIYREWFCVRHALTKAGAQIDVIPHSSKGGMREVYTRDRYVLVGDTAYLPDPDELQGLNDDGALETDELDIESYKGEIAQVKKALEDRGVKTVVVPGAWFEGGNVVRHYSSRTLFVGIDGAWSSEDSADRLMDAINATQRDKWTLVPVPLANPDEMYHLDTGMSEELPKGEVMISPLVTDKETFREITAIVGENNIIKLAPEDARKLATNLIDVGNTLVMTGNCPKLAEKLAKRGYDVVQPSDYGQEDFEFGMGGVHCMTNDVKQPRRRPSPPKP